MRYAHHDREDVMGIAREVRRARSKNLAGVVTISGTVTQQETSDSRNHGPVAQLHQTSDLCPSAFQYIRVSLTTTKQMNRGTSRMYGFVPRCTRYPDKNPDRIVVVSPAVIHTGHEPEGGGRWAERLFAAALNLVHGQGVHRVREARQFFGGTELWQHAMN